LIEPGRHLAPDAANRIIQRAMLAVQDYLAGATPVKLQPPWKCST